MIGFKLCLLHSCLSLSVSSRSLKHNQLQVHIVIQVRLVFLKWSSWISSRLCSHTKAIRSLGMTMTSSELLPSVMSATLFKEAGVTLSALHATFSATHPNASKAMTNLGCGRGVLFRALDSHSCRFLAWALSDKKRQLVLSSSASTAWHP